MVSVLFWRADGGQLDRQTHKSGATGSYHHPHPRLLFLSLRRDEEQSFAYDPSPILCKKGQIGQKTAPEVLRTAQQPKKGK